MRLSFVTLGARDIKKLGDFYKGLGWKVAFEAPDGFVSFRLGGAILALWPLDQLAAEAAPNVEPPSGGWRGVTLASNVDAKDDVDTTFAAWVDAGATPITRPWDTDWGGRTSYVADPEGNRWEIAWNDAVRFTADGGVAGFAEG
jgi:hypothetical protein